MNLQACRGWLGWLLASAVLLSGCAAQVVPLNQASHDFGLTEEEQKLHEVAQQLSSELNSRGLILPDPETTALVNTLGRRLLPPDLPPTLKFTFSILRDPTPQAFALPNGHIYVNTGLLACLQDESQLAFVLAHEIAHVIHRDALGQRQERASAILVAHVANVALLGTAVAYLPALGTLASYSREREAAADMAAYQRILQLGYPPSASWESLQSLRRDLPARPDTDSMFASHPKLSERQQHLRAMPVSATATAAPLAAGDYRQVQIRAGLLRLELLLQYRQYRQAMRTAHQLFAQAGETAQLHSLRGEILRRMAEDPDGAAIESALLAGTLLTPALKQEQAAAQEEWSVAARQCFTRALEINPGHAPTYRGMGLLYYRNGDRHAARQALQKYLEFEPAPKDRRYIQHIIDECQKEA